MRNGWYLLALVQALVLAGLLYWYVEAIHFERYGFGVAAHMAWLGFAAVNIGTLAAVVALVLGIRAALKRGRGAGR